MIVEIILSISICGLIFSFNMLIRNKQTFKEMMKIHDAIFKKDKNGNFINSSEIITLTRRRDSIASYNQMVFTFWKSLKSFYKEFLEELETKNQEKEAKIK